MAALGTRHVGRHGYVMVALHGRRNRIGEHRLIAEEALGRALVYPEQVHHVNGDKQDNRRENLAIIPGPGYHRLLEKRQRALAACGDPNAARCIYCHGYSDQPDMSHLARGVSYHRRCAKWASWTGYRRSQPSARRASLRAARLTTREPFETRRCVDCTSEFTWSRVGRPRLRCDKCRAGRPGIRTGRPALAREAAQYPNSQGEL